MGVNHTFREAIPVFGEQSPPPTMTPLIISPFSTRLLLLIALNWASADTIPRHRNRPQPPLVTRRATGGVGLRSNFGKRKGVTNTFDGFITCKKGGAKRNYFIDFYFLHVSGPYKTPKRRTRLTLNSLYSTVPKTAECLSARQFPARQGEHRASRDTSPAH